MAVHVYKVENKIDPSQAEVSLSLTGQFYTGEITGSIVSNNGLLEVQVQSGEFRYGQGDKQPIISKPGETIYVNLGTMQACFETGPIKNG